MFFVYQRINSNDVSPPLERKKEEGEKDPTNNGKNLTHTSVCVYVDVRNLDLFNPRRQIDIDKRMFNFQ